eukprot:767167-Hanusia_phi.AAC.3
MSSSRASSTATSSSRASSPATRSSRASSPAMSSSRASSPAMSSSRASSTATSSSQAEGEGQRVPYRMFTHVVQQPIDALQHVSNALILLLLCRVRQHGELGSLQGLAGEPVRPRHPAALHLLHAPALALD